MKPRIDTGEHFWISGPKRNGADRLYRQGGVPIDEDAREEYWRDIRGATARFNRACA